MHLSLRRFVLAFYQRFCLSLSSLCCAPSRPVFSYGSVIHIFRSIQAFDKHHSLTNSLHSQLREEQQQNEDIHSRYGNCRRRSGCTLTKLRLEPDSQRCTDFQCSAIGTYRIVACSISERISIWQPTRQLRQLCRCYHLQRSSSSIIWSFWRSCTLESALRRPQRQPRNGSWALLGWLWRFPTLPNTRQRLSIIPCRHRQPVPVQRSARGS